MVSSASMPQLKASILFLLRKSRETSQILQIHAQLITNSLIDDPFTFTQFFSSLTSIHPLNLAYARLVFSQVPNLSTYLYNIMIRAYVSCSKPRGALGCYMELRRSGLSCDSYTFPLVLKGCGLMMGLVEGRQVHGEIVKGGYGCNVFVANGLIGMYAKCGEMGSAWMAFDGLEGKDVVSWNLMLGGYVGVGDMAEAQKVFDRMPDRDVISWSIMIDAYGKKFGDLVRARAVFDEMPVKDVVSWNSMLAGYAKSGELEAAHELFALMPEKNVISWSIMLDGYALHGNPQKALELFGEMLREGLKLDKMSVIGALSACAQLGALVHGRWIHTYMKKEQIDIDRVVQTALLDMYIKCGSLDEAQRMFSRMTEKNVISYTVMILGLGINGYGKEALEYFSQMILQGIPPDDTIFLGVLTACSHSGLVTEGLHIFHQMKRIHGINPKLEHYGCLVDLLGRSGLLNQACAIIENLPMKPNSAVWGSLLLAGRTHQSVGVAELAMERLKELNADDSGTYILLSNIYADVGLWKESLRIRELIKSRNINKEMAKSVVEVNDSIQEFISGEKFSTINKELGKVIWSLSKIAVCAG